MGWIVENIYCLSTEKRFQNDGFLKGPYKPMYGIAMIILLLCQSAFGDSFMFMTILCFIIPTAIEYLSAHMLKTYFNKVYWDYSDFKHNLSGYVCLEFSCYWTILGIGIITLIHPILDSFYMNNMESIFYVTAAAVPIFTTDLIITIIKALKAKVLAE